MSVNILIIKTSSLGDVIHTLPALTDAASQIKCQFDWVVEENFAEIPQWHPAVRRVIPVAVRRWRKNPIAARGEWQHFVTQLQQQNYDYVIDAQGLFKSAWLSRWAVGKRHGLDWHSAREPWASWAYHQRYFVDKQQHAVERVRQLFAQVLNYSLDNLPLDYGIAAQFPRQSAVPNTLIFLHGTAWRTKQLPESLWFSLAERAIAAGFHIRLTWGDAAELARARRIAAASSHIELIEKGNLHSFATALSQAQTVIGVDTGLAHLAAALAIPSMTIYGATAPRLTGTYNVKQLHVLTAFPCSPCFRKKCRYPQDSELFPPCYGELSLDQVWQKLQELLA